MFDSPIPNSKKEASVSGISDEKLRENEKDMTPNVGTPKLSAPTNVGTPKIGTPLNVSFKNTPNSLKKVISGASICNDGTPVDVPKLRPGNEPPIPPNKNEIVANNVPDEEDVRTIKKHLFDSPMGASGNYNYDFANF